MLQHRNVGMAQSVAGIAGENSIEAADERAADPEPLEAEVGTMSTLPSLTIESVHGVKFTLTVGRDAAAPKSNPAPPSSDASQDSPADRPGGKPSDRNGPG
ncbi:hypothetical protein [Roseiconus nitratireducens]|uniref:hypothetical protein n=1 Tax=Roseiconus nitratireducens TaxID=2605748 RepID=UPI00137600AB|nr:hypothetical protein [Roseiconus nitratireducens]